MLVDMMHPVHYIEQIERACHRPTDPALNGLANPYSR